MDETDIFDYFVGISGKMADIQNKNLIWKAKEIFQKYVKKI